MNNLDSSCSPPYKIVPLIW
ncbi:unnamed protein product [Tuber melanosporum]|uniref:(Perigord truffle) hypothetical protein n=1 Tax=Tuber melanosporum (strain Mel28) TaxID=656061 RepID=D5GPJ2_TUBMM|nr:unnamed protein product [Tuber melanosporum]